MMPTVVAQDNVALPRYSVVHLLDPNSGRRFPDRTMYYFKDIDKSKKVFSYNVVDLVTKDEVTTIANKYLDRELRNWRKVNLTRFREIDVFAEPNKDLNNLTVINYNPVKDLYRYKTSPVSEYAKHRNLSNTFWSYIKKAVEASRDSVQIVPIELPNLIPSYVIMNRLLTFSEYKLTRILTEPQLFWILELYQWLDDKTRPNSPLKDITDKDSSSIVLELKFKNYSTFLPLSVLRGTSVDSDIESTVKYATDKVLKVFIILLLKIQEQVASLTTLQVEETEEPDYTKDDEELDEKVLHETDKRNPEEPISITRFSSGSKEDPKVPVPKEEPLVRYKKIEELDADEDLKLDIDMVLELDSYDDFDRTVDQMFEKSIKQAELAKSNKKVIKSKVDKGTTEPDTEEPIEEDSPIRDVPTEEVASSIRTSSAREVHEKFIVSAKENKSLSAPELRSLRNLVETREKLVSPYENTSIDKYIASKPIDLPLSHDKVKLDVDLPLVPENLKTDKIKAFDKVYLDNVYKKDIVDCIVNLEKAGIVIKDYEVELTQNAINKYETHKLTLKPLIGKESTVYFRLPVIDDEGTYLVSGVRYRTRKTKQDRPIRKISPIRVALTSNYGKFFVSRTERKTNDRSDYILSFIRKDYLGENLVVDKLVPAKKDLTLREVPNDYFLLASNFNLIQTKEFTFLLREEDLAEHVKKEVIPSVVKTGTTFIGYNLRKEILVIDKNNRIRNFSRNMEEVGTVETILGLNQDKIPKPFSVMKVLGTDIPLGIVLSYYLGISTLLKLTSTNYTVLEVNKRYQEQPNQLVLRFEDYKLILDTDTVEKQLLFNGFLFFKDPIKRYKLRFFDNKDVYLNILESRKVTLFHIKELESLLSLFIDPITKDILEELNEPTDFIPLLLRANQLLVNFQHPAINDPEFSRIRGYDRVPGLMYNAIVESVREHNFKGRANSKISLDPYKVWNYVTQDNTVKSREVLNPLLSLKENEAITLTGRDGLSTDAVPKEMRRYHPKDTGLISEGTVDSKDVAIVSYLTPYAKFKGIRGTVDTDSTEVKDNPAKAFSSPVQQAPFAEYDDGKRLNFINIQYSHTVPSEGYRQPPMRTGYEYLLPYKTDSSFCVVAEEAGKVVEVTAVSLTVQYKDKTTKVYPIGTTYGDMEGSTYVHELITELSTGSTFKKGEVLAHHKDFFEKDILDPTRLIFKTTRTGTVALTIDSDVFEDSSAISAKFAETLSTTIIKKRTFVLDFKSNLINVVKEGEVINPNDILFVSLDETTDGSNLSEQSLTILQNLAALSPRAKYAGVVDRLEIRYNGDKEDMSTSVSILTSRLDKKLYERTKGTPYEAKTNKVNREYRSNGKSLELDTFELTVYIKTNLGLGNGDKLVFGNQAKSVICNTWPGTILTESGDEVDGKFGYIGIIGRIINSPIIMGTSNRLLRLYSTRVANAYFD